MMAMPMMMMMTMGVYLQHMFATAAAQNSDDTHSVFASPKKEQTFNKKFFAERQLPPWQSEFNKCSYVCVATH